MSCTYKVTSAASIYHEVVINTFFTYTVLVKLITIECTYMHAFYELACMASKSKS